MAQGNVVAWDGTQFLSGLQAAATWLEQHVGEINALNVFPVPDGDTGTNMHLTMSAALKDVAPHSSAASVAKQVERQALRGARGNSGVILSQIIRGFSEGIAGTDTLDAAGLALAFQKAAERAYKAVMKPTEGTILTVARVVGEQAAIAAENGGDVSAVLDAAVSGSQAGGRRYPQPTQTVARRGRRRCWR